jgi:hypothetical protein
MPSNESLLSLDKSDILKIREALDLKEGELFPTDQLESDKKLEKFLDFKEKLFDRNENNPYGVYEFQPLPASMFSAIEVADPEFAEALDLLEKKELALKTSLSPINPLFLKHRLANKEVFEATGEIKLGPEVEAHAFAVSIGLEDVQKLLDDTEHADHADFKSRIVRKFNIDLTEVAEEEHSAHILDAIREDTRDRVNKLVQNHTGHTSSTSNWHVTGIITDSPENVTKDLQVLVYDTLNKIYSPDKIDPARAGHDFMVTYCPDTVQSTTFFKLNESTVEASYSTLGTINQANNALNMGLMARQPLPKDVELSPFMYIDKTNDGAVPENYYKATNDRKGTTFAFRPVALTHSPEQIDQMRAEVVAALPEKFSPKLTVSEMREIQEIKVASFTPLRAIEQHTLDKFKNNDISPEVYINVGEAEVAQVRLVKVENIAPVVTDRRGNSAALMTDFSGYSKMSQHLTSLEMDASELIQPLMQKIAAVVEKTNGLCDDFAGDSVRIIYPSEDVIRKMHGEKYKKSLYTGLGSAEKTLLTEIAIFKLKENHERDFEDIVKTAHEGQGAQFMELLNVTAEKVPSEEDFATARQVISSEQDPKVKNALGYVYARAKVEASKGALGIKSFSVTGNCSMSFSGSSTDLDRTKSESRRTVSNENLSAMAFDLKRSEMEYASRHSSIVIDKESYDKLLNPEIRQLLSEIKLESGKIAYGIDIQEALRNRVVNDVFASLGI